MVELTLTSKISGRVIKSAFTARQLLESDEQTIVETMAECGCDMLPRGETNVVECSCDEEWYEYTLVIGEHDAEIKRLRTEIGHLATAWQHSTADEIYQALPRVIPKIIQGEEWSI